MPVATVGSLTQLARIVGRLRQDDVLVFGAWRITVASDPLRPFWLEGHGQVFQIERGKGAGGKLRRLIEDFGKDCTA